MIGALLTLIVYIIVLGLLYWLITYLLGVFPLPDPAPRVIQAIVVVIFVIIVIFLLLDVVGVGNYGLPRLTTGGKL